MSVSQFDDDGRHSFLLLHGKLKLVELFVVVVVGNHRWWGFELIAFKWM